METIQTKEGKTYCPQCRQSMHYLNKPGIFRCDKCHIEWHIGGVKE